MAIRKKELPNPRGEFACDVAACECLFFTRLDFLLHQKRGQHGRMNYEEGGGFRRVIGNYAERGQRQKEQAYSRQGKL